MDVKTSLGSCPVVVANLHLEVMELQLTGGCLYLVHNHGLPLEELVSYRQILHWEEGGEEEEAQEGEAEDLGPASQGRQGNGRMRQGGWPSVWTETAAETWS